MFSFIEVKFCFIFALRWSQPPVITREMFRQRYPRGFKVVRYHKVCLDGSTADWAELFLFGQALLEKWSEYAKPKAGGSGTQSF